ncbi:MAG: STAS domain-containing protein [Muribaculaceae bacterium]|nr:STAS domain-containing protein [Muribaculaceae bacterium]
METNIVKNEGITTLTIKGRVDTTTSTLLDETIQPLCIEKGIELVVDVAEMSYISSSGLRCFITLLKSVAHNQGKMKVINMQQNIKEIFEMTGFTEYFEIN